MKKLLYTTTILSAIGAVGLLNSPVHAQSKTKKMQLGVSGFFQSAISFSEQSGSFESTSGSTSRVGYDSFNIWTDSEINFTGSTKLDNGITVEVTVELESDQVNGGASIDESFLRLTGTFGDVRIGSLDGVTNTLATSAPATGVTGPNDGDFSFAIIQPANVSVTADTLLGGSKITKLVYYTPEISGFQVGLSYEPSNQNANSVPATGGNAGTDTQEYNAGVAYNGNIGNFGITADLSYSERKGTAANSAKGLRGGINLSAGGIAVGGSYKDISSTETGIDGTANSPEETGFDIGIQYDTGPWSVSATYLQAERPLAAATTGDDEVSTIALGANYVLGPGIDLQGNVVWTEWNDEGTADANNNDGWAVVGGIMVTF